MPGFVGVRRRFRHGTRVLFDFLLQIANPFLKLCVGSFERRMRQVVDHHIGIDAVSFNKPFAFGTVDSDLCSGGDSLVGQEIT